MAPIRSTVSDILTHAAAQFVDNPALLADGESLSFRQLEDRAAAFAGGLFRAGVRAGDRVLLYLPNGWRWIVAYHAIARLGGVVAPANSLLSPSEIAFMARDCEAAALILPVDRSPVAEEARRTAPSLKTIVTVGVDRTLQDGFMPFADLLNGPPWDGPQPAPEDLFTVAYTSGTTGRPKGAMLTQRAIFDSAAMTATLHVRSRNDVVVSALPFAHVYGNIVMNAGLLSGAKLIAMGRFDAGDTLRTIARERATLFEGVPTMYYQMLGHPEIRDADLSSLWRCTVGGQTMPTSSMQEVAARFACPLLELWGMTEVAGPAVSHSPYWPPRLGAIGKAFTGISSRIIDLSSGLEAVEDEPGELQVRGSLVMKGYWGSPEASATAVDQDGWLSTGDIARKDAEGYIYMVDRLKDMIITAGYNVYPAEIEQVLALHPAVAVVAVAGVADAEKGELAKAFVVLREDMTVTEDEILKHCRLHLAAYKIPRQIAFVADLPKTSTGKIMRRSLSDVSSPLKGSAQ